MKAKVVSCCRIVLPALVAAWVAIVDCQSGFAQGRNRIAERFRQVDKDNNGKVTKSELPQPVLFGRIDRNDDGAITLEETRAAVVAGVLNQLGVPEPQEPANSDEPAATAPADDASEIRQGPRLLKGGDHGVGRLVPDLTFKDIDGQSHKLSDFRDKRAVVIVMTGTGCPLCLKYAPSLAAVEKMFRDRDVAFVFVNPNESEKIDRLQEAIAAHGFRGPYVRDSRKEIPRALGAETTTEVFVLDSARTIVYRGAVDDQYGFGYALDAPRATYLIDALEAVLAGQTPTVTATSSPGCELYYDAATAPQAQTAVTYHNRVSRIIQANCIECHRGDGIAPIALETYPEVKDYAGMIRRVIEREIMPPWFAAPLPDQDQKDGHSLRWANERSLSADEKRDLFAWIQGGTPEGDAQDAPLPRKFPGGWLIGQPDAVFEFSRPVKVKATGTMPYQNITVETDLSEDKWVQAIEVRPGNRAVVHHVIVSLQSREADERSGYWGVYVPGNSTLVYPDGFAKLLPKGAKMRFQMHYTPNGTATEDRTQIGLIFAKEPPKHEVKVTGIANTKIKIPPGADNHPEFKTLTLQHDARVLGFLPHMHLRGKAARYEVVTSDGTEVLLDVPRYDFNWQLLYQLAEPLTLKQGDTIRYTSWYDNSEDNPANPDPKRTVRWGQQTDDEMHIGYVEYIVPGLKPGESVDGMRRAKVAGAARSVVGSALFRRLDVDKDGLITRTEVRERMPGNTQAAGPIFDRLDKDGNGKLDKAEFSEA